MFDMLNNSVKYASNMLNNSELSIDQNNDQTALLNVVYNTEVDSFDKFIMEVMFSVINNRQSPKLLSKTIIPDQLPYT